MTVAEVLTSVGIYTTILFFVLKWLKDRSDDQADEINALISDVNGANEQIRKEHNTLAHLIAKDYMDSEKTMEMYSLMSKATEQKVDAVFKKVDKMADQVDKILLLMAEKNK